MTTQLILVEDDAGLRGDLVEFLELEGFSVVSCGNALEFFRKLVGQTFGVALIDLGLPDEAGEVLVDYVRGNTTSSIVVLTARDTLETRVQCYRNGADLFLGKPVNCIELATIIRNLLKRRVATSSSEYTARDHTQGKEDYWTLQVQCRTLKTPAPQPTVISLTTMQFNLLEQLMSSNGPVDRWMLLERLYGRTDQSAERALETLVRRVRQHISESTGKTAPILTYSGLGYAFAASVKINR
ncbi:MAG: response regulator transcription factor [Opitutaceae bacterium]